MKDTINYQLEVQKALRHVIKNALKTGVVGDHHFYITFKTDHPGVEVPQYLKDRYPGEMTIVLQHQFDNLRVSDTSMSVTLYFNNKPERLTIPMAAITIFADPSVNFAMEFPVMHEESAVAPVTEGNVVMLRGK